MQLIAKLQVKYLNDKFFNLVLIFGFFSASNVDTIFIIYIYQKDFKHAHGKLDKHNQIFLEPRFTPHKPKCRAEIQSRNPCRYFNVQRDSKRETAFTSILTLIRHLIQTNHFVFAWCRPLLATYYDSTLKSVVYTLFQYLARP